MKKLNLNLQLFSDGGEGANGGTATESGADTAIAEQTAQSVQTVQTEEDDFETLVGKGGKHEQAYKAKTEKLIKNRVKGLSGKLAQYEQLAERISTRYGIDASADFDGLVKAIETDTSAIAEKAMEMGLSPEQYLEFERLQTFESRIMKQQKADNENKAKAQVEQIWAQQSEEARAIYPDFDFETEYNAEGLFKNMIERGVPVKAAYEVAHLNDIMTGAMQFAAKQTEKNVVDAVKANGARPVEGGLSSQSANVGKIDISKLTSAQIDDYVKRAARGENITFR